MIVSRLMVGCINKASRLIARILICLSLLVAKSAYCQTETLTGTISLPLSMTSNDREHKLKIDITEWDKDNIEVATSTKLVDILRGSTSVNYQIDYPQPHKNNKVNLFIRCYRGCDFLNGLYRGYVLQEDGSFSNKHALVAPELLLSEQNLQFSELPPSKTLKGTISLPASVSRNENDIEVSVELVVGSSNYKAPFYFSRSENITIESGKTSADYKIDYYSSENHSIELIFYCDSNCAALNPLRKRFTLQDDGSFTDDDAFTSVKKVKRIPASAFPKRQDFQIPKPTIKKTLTGTFSLPDSIRVPKTGMSISVAIEVLDKDGEPVDFRRETNLSVPHGSMKISYELDYYLPEGSTQARLSFVCGWCNGFGNFKYLQKDGSYSQDDNSDPIPIEEFPEKVDYQYDGQEQYSLLERFWWWVLSLGR